MCISPKTSRTNINSIFLSKNADKNIYKEDNNKLNNKRLSSRNNENMKNSKKNIYKKIIPNYLIQFSSNNSTSSNTGNFNNAKTNNHICNEYEKGYKNPNYIKRNMKYFKRQDYSNVLIDNRKEKVDNIFKKYKKKTYNSHINKSNNQIKKRHNRSLSKNLNQELVISKIADKLVVANINKINNFKLNPNKCKFDVEKTFFCSTMTKENNSYLKTNSKNNINFPKSTNYTNLLSINNINSLPISRHSALTSSTGKIYSKNRQVNSNRSNRPNSNDNIKKYKNIRNKGSENKKGIIMNLSKSKDLYNNLTFNNYCKKQVKHRNGIGLNNNKIEYVQINLFNNGIEDRINKEKNYIIIKEIYKKGISNSNSKIKKVKKNKEKEVKLFDSDINGSNGSNDGIYMTKSFLSINDKSRLTKDLFTPEENHFQAVNFVQLIKINNKKFS